VCDYPAVREGLALLVNREFDLEVAATTKLEASAVRAASELKPDVALIDLSDKGRNIELIKEIASRSPVLVFSVSERAIHAKHILGIGARAYVLKREPTSTLMTAMRRVISGGTYVSEGISAGLVDLLYAPPRLPTDAELLSARERLVLQHIGEGLTTRQIAESLFVSVKTVETHRARIKTKLNIRTSSDLLQYAIKWAKSEFL
jgi:DNA-binding NarL/FixJ family response regulator